MLNIVYKMHSWYLELSPLNIFWWKSYSREIPSGAVAFVCICLVCYVLARPSLALRVCQPLVEKTRPHLLLLVEQQKHRRVMDRPNTTRVQHVVVPVTRHFFSSLSAQFSQRGATFLLSLYSYPLYSLLVVPRVFPSKWNFWEIRGAPLICPSVYSTALHWVLSRLFPILPSLPL